MRNPIWWVLIALGIFAFYWFEIRASSIRKMCYVEATEDAKKHMQAVAEVSSEDETIQAAVKNDWVNKKAFDSYYRDCLRRNGLKE